MITRWVLPPTFLVSLLLALPSSAQDETKEDPLPKQKATAEAAWKMLEIKPNTFETENLLVYSTIDGPRLEPITKELQKIYLASVKALRYSKDESPWPGKLAVHVFTDRADFGSFLRRFEKRSAKGQDASSVLVRGDQPHVAVGPSISGAQAAIEAHVASQARYAVAAALLVRKAGSSARPPDWVQQGFGRAVVHRASGARTTNPAWAKMLKKPHTLKELWDGSLTGDEANAYAALVVDYLAFGPVAGNFVPFIEALKPGDRGQPPSIAEALEAAKTSVAAVEKGLRTWR